MKWRQDGEMRPISDCLGRRREKSTDSVQLRLPIYEYHGQNVGNWDTDMSDYLINPIKKVLSVRNS